MKVIHVYRSPKPNRHSIERVFTTIESHMPAEVTIEKFYVNPQLSILANLRRVSKLKADVFHITGDCNYLALGLPKRKTILTVHDVGHYEVTLKGLRKIIYGFFWWRWPLRNVNQIVAISNFTKKRIERNFNIPSERIKVIYDPLPADLTGDADVFNQKHPTVLQIGSGKHKNISGLVAALNGLNAKLILINDVNEEIKELLMINKIEYEQYHNLPYNEVIAIYKRADILFFASFYEGFGMPIIEAQGLGVPVITSIVGPMPEVAGQGALLVNPYSVAEIRGALLKIITSSSLRDELVEKGKENVKRFGSQVIADEYYNIYKRLSRNED